MIVVPAIDLVGGRCVRLAQGDFARETRYDASPQAALDAFATAGAREVHVVDLDGARSGRPVQHDLLRSLATSARVALQVAGGVRSAQDVASLLDVGVARVVIGSMALAQPDLFEALLSEHGADRLVLALDVRVSDDGVLQIARHGWQSVDAASFDEVMTRHPGLRHILVTDIGRDGMLGGPNLPLARRIVAQYPHVALQASGGVGALDDIDALAATGAARAIVGKALWERRFTLEEAIARAGG